MVARLVLEYDGRGFAGWARQPGLRTVQAEVERALSVVLRGALRLPVSVAGRTDAGVHAWGQVCSYVGAPARISSLNALLPFDVAALSCSLAGDGFDARRSATSRAYCYRVLLRRARGVFERGRALHWPYEVDAGLLSACAAALVGTHDFTAFTPTVSEHVRFARDVYAAFWRASPAEGRGAAPGGVETGLARGGGRAAGEVLEFWIEADAFMRNMNRVLVGTMLQVAGGRRSFDDFVRLLSGRPRSEAGPTAPPWGLYLAGVGYKGVRVLGPGGFAGSVGVSAGVAGAGEGGGAGCS